MKSRVKELRKKLNLTQAEFGEKLGVTAAAISDIENGRRNLTNRNITLICEKFHVDKTWLCHGMGNCFDVPNLPEDDLSAALAQIESEEYEAIKHLLLKYVTLDDVGKKVVNDFLDYFLNKMDKE